MLKRYTATNYSMGRSIKTVQFNAYSDQEAGALAEKRVPGANALPGSSPKAAAKAQVIGVTCLGFA